MIQSEPPSAANGRERCLSAAYELFCRHGIQAVGVDRIVAEAGVAKMTLYRHFPSKEELVLASLERRELEWTSGWLAREANERGRTAQERLLALFDLFDEWFRSEDYEGCLFLNTVLEGHDPKSRVALRAVAGMDDVRKYLRGLAEDAGIRDAEVFARRWHVLLYGAIGMASSGYVDAALRAKEVAEPLLRAELG